MEEARHNRLRSGAIIVALWLLCAVGAALLHRFAWGAAPHDSAIDALLLRAANVANIAMLPGWAFNVLVFGSAGVATLTGLLIGCAVGSAAWVGAACALWRGRSLLHRAAHSLAAPIPADPARRRFLLDGAGAAAALTVAGAGARASLVDPWDLRIRRDTVPIDDLPPELEGLRIVQICDTHLGPRVPASFIRRAVELAAELKPDIAALVGDYVHNDLACIDPSARLFDSLISGARIGAIGVLGNHDWYADGARMRNALRARGVHMLDNDRLFLDAHRSLHTGAPSGPALCLAGLADLTEEGIDLPRAFRDVRADTPRILLAHNPDTAEDPQLRRGPAGLPHRIDLMLSGHTHGGQVRLPFVGTPIVPSRYGQKYAAGLIQAPTCRVLVSRGVGMSILPVRFGVRPEIGEITLVRA